MASKTDTIPVIFVTGVKVTTEDGLIMVTGWDNLPEVGEQRVVIRFAMPKTAAAELMAQLSQKI